MHSRGEEEFLWLGDNQYGDWLALDNGDGTYIGASDPDLIASAYFAYSTSILVKTLKVLNKDSSHYEKLLNNMMEELDELPKKSPDIMVYLKISFEKTLERIGKRGRDFEQDEGLYDYYYRLWKDYDDWIMNHYEHSNVLIIDMDQIDVEANPEQISLIIEQIKKAELELSEETLG